MTNAPLPTLGLRMRHRVDGSPFLVAVVDERLVLEPGTELHLIRVHHDTGGPHKVASHALRVLPPQVAPSTAERRRAASDRLDASALRRDPRDEVRP